MTDFRKIVELVTNYPGLDGLALKGKGWRPQIHGSLRYAEKVGLIVYLNGGWHIESNPTGEREKEERR